MIDSKNNIKRFEEDVFVLCICLLTLSCVLFFLRCECCREDRKRLLSPTVLQSVQVLHKSTVCTMCVLFIACVVCDADVAQMQCECAHKRAC